MENIGDREMNPPNIGPYMADDSDEREVFNASTAFLDSVYGVMCAHLEEESESLHSPSHKEALIAKYRELELLAEDSKTNGYELLEAVITSLRKQQTLTRREWK